jgi:hypothetical protein
MSKIESEDVINFCRKSILGEEAERDRRNTQPYAASRELKSEAATGAYLSVIRFLEGER